MKNESRLSYSELLSLDSAISLAQEQGISLDDSAKVALEHLQDVCMAHEAMHKGIGINPDDVIILAEIRQLAKKLKFAPTLNQLVELRKTALNQLYNKGLKYDDD